MGSERKAEDSTMGLVCPAQERGLIHKGDGKPVTGLIQGFRSQICFVISVAGVWGMDGWNFHSSK